MAELPVITLTGTAHERGLTHGRELHDRIAANVDLYRGRLADDAGLTPAEIAERVELYLSVFTRLDPEYRAAMEGIAEGSEQSLEDIVMLNARFELLYSAWSAAGTTPPSECTGFGAEAGVTDDGKRWIGQNWDWFPGVAGALLTWRDNDVSVLAYTEAGIAGPKIGVNSAGIGLCVNGLGCDADDWRLGGMPYHLRTSRILGSSTLKEAVAHASLDAPSCSANYVIGSASEGIVDVETSPVGSRRIPCAPDATLVHANHFLDPNALGVKETWRTWPATTFRRQERLETLLAATRPLSVDAVETALRDHEGGSFALCRHPDMELPEPQRIHTAFSAVIDLTDGVLRYTEGPPCESQPVEARL